MNIKKLRKEHSRIKEGIAKGEIKITHYDNPLEFLKDLHSKI